MGKMLWTFPGLTLISSIISSVSTSHLNEVRYVICLGVTPTCGPTPGTPTNGQDFSGFQTDMLGNPIIPASSQSAEPVDMLGNPIRSNSSSSAPPLNSVVPAPPVEQPKEEQSKINGVNIVGVVDTTEETNIQKDDNATVGMLINI